MEMRIQNPKARWAFVAVEILAVVVILVWTIRVLWAARLAERPAVETLRQAVRLDPWNADYQLQLARQYHYNPMELETDKATHHLQRAIQLNPHNPVSWLELAAVLELSGKSNDAEAALRRAHSLAPNLPNIQWAIGNFYLLRGETSSAFHHLRAVLAGGWKHNELLFDRAWKASNDPDQILEALIPRQTAVELDYLNYLAKTQRYPEAKSVWKRIVADPQEFSAKRTAPYLDALIGSGQADVALGVWQDLRAKGLIPATYGLGAANLVTNGDFEENLLNMGFDWRITEMEGVYAGLDGMQFHSPSRSLLVHFRERANYDYRHVQQFVKVTPGKPYLLTAFLRSERLTSDTGPRLEVRDPFNPLTPAISTESLRGTSAAWTRVSVQFTAGPQTDCIVVEVARPPSTSLDNLLTGRLWVDDVRLVEVSP